ncbi:hypothetical protein Bca52824_061752 [Brassica carinata]|uniref:Uncharacterized protein n=1 Tax=Brassica carinata TaxID=52824 RepID=A0A8X7U620_BRACI|nr:hypothetical protein Bca52824_061752 [Brassica carinata]
MCNPTRDDGSSQSGMELGSSELYAPKWLEYPIAYAAVFALQCGGRNNVMDLKQQWFYRFLRKTIGFHVLMFWTVLYLYGGLPYLTCGGVPRDMARKLRMPYLGFEVVED